jgi:hypothetical protein
LYLSRDSSEGEDAAPDGRCTPIPLVVSLFQVVLGGTCAVYEVGRGRKSLSGSLSVSSMEQVVDIFCLGRRGGDMWDGGSVLYLVLRIWECGMLGRSWVEVRSDSCGGDRSGGSKI